MRTLRPRSLASLVLAREGITLSTIAEALGVSTSAVSMQLAGRRRLHPALIPVLRAIAGPKVAQEVAAASDEQAGR